MPEDKGEGIHPPEKHEPKIHAGDKAEIKPRSHASIPSEPKIESLESKKSKSRLKGVRGKLAALGLGIVTGIGAANVAADSNEGAQNDSSQKTSLAESQNHPQVAEVQGERAVYERGIEEKYGIKLLNMKEGFEHLGINYDETNEAIIGRTPPIRWSLEQLTSIDKFLAYFPTKFYKPGEEKTFALSIWDYGEENRRAGGMWGPMMDVGRDAFTSSDKEGQFSLLAHEFGHRMDDDELKKGIEEIVLADKNFTKSWLFVNDNKYSTRNPDIPQVVATFENLVFDNGVEGRANFFQTYVKGYERFMRAVGPVLDGGEFDPDIDKSEFELLYPRAKSLHEFYKGIFEGIEYNEIQKELNPDFKYLDPSKELTKPSQDVSESTEKESPEYLMEKFIENKYNLSLINFTDQDFSTEELYAIKKIIEVFPEEFYSSIDGKKLSIILTDDDTRKRHDGHTIILNRESITYDPSTYATHVDAVGEITHGLIHRTVEARGYLPQDRLLNLLGGKKFTDNPEKLFPKLFKPTNKYYEQTRKKFFNEDGILVSPEEMLAIIGERYLQGPRDFQAFLDIFDNRNTIKIFNGNPTTKKYKKNLKSSYYYRLYNLIGDEFFNGKEFLTSYGNFPSQPE